MNSPVDTWRAETLGAAAVAALIKNGFDALYLATGDDARTALLHLARPGMTVGLGGSMSVKSLGIAEGFAAAGARILDHNAPGLSPEDKLGILRSQLTCDLFVSGSNALTLGGEIVNVDGNGNRVAALTFGPRKTVVVMGVNKIVRTLDEAMARLEEVASPMNNKRLERANPCVQKGICMDCHNESRICRVYQVLKRRPALSDFTVFVVGESLGF